MVDVIVIGGGLAGLINSILLKRAGFDVHLFEEKKYPFHRVCGEYISNEVIPFLERNNLFPKDLNPSSISNFHLSSVKGKSLKMPLDLGGFGVSRYTLDQWLVEKAESLGVEVKPSRIISCEFNEDHHELIDRDGNFHQAKIVVGAFGKRSTLDKSLNRAFIQKRHPFVGVKYHIKTNEVANDVVELHNFQDGYCGTSRVENDVFNLCYLSHRNNLKKNGSIEKMEEQVLFRNPHLKRIFSNSEFLLEKPEVINEITFEKKEPVFNHILMSGDSAGMITPLCGNGMAMAIHSAKVLTETITQHFNGKLDRPALENDYVKRWNTLFANRLWVGRSIQRLFGSAWTSELAVFLGKNVSPISRFLMNQTHGDPF